MILDSPLLSADDIDVVRSAIRRVLWDGDEPETADLATKVRELVGDGVLPTRAAQLAADMYGLGGPGTARPPARPAAERATTGCGAPSDWRARLLAERNTPFHNEPDLVGRIGYRELNYGAVPDGKPLDPAVGAARNRPPATSISSREPYDLVAAMPGFTWPTVVISGGRDLTTPPAVARRIADLIPDSVLVEMPNGGHSIIDIRERLCARDREGRPGRTADELPGRAAATRRRAQPAQRAAAEAGDHRGRGRGVGGAVGGAARGSSRHYFMKPIAV